MSARTHHRPAKSGMGPRSKSESTVTVSPQTQIGFVCKPQFKSEMKSKSVTILSARSQPDMSPYTETLVTPSEPESKSSCKSMQHIRYCGSFLMDNDNRLEPVIKRQRIPADDKALDFQDLESLQGAEKMNALDAGFQRRRFRVRMTYDDDELDRDGRGKGQINLHSVDLLTENDEMLIMEEVEQLTPILDTIIKDIVGQIREIAAHRRMPGSTVACQKSDEASDESLVTDKITPRTFDRSPKTSGRNLDTLPPSSHQLDGSEDQNHEDQNLGGGGDGVRLSPLPEDDECVVVMVPPTARTEKKAEQTPRPVLDPPALHQSPVKIPNYHARSGHSRNFRSSTPASSVDGRTPSEVVVDMRTVPHHMIPIPSQDTQHRRQHSLRSDSSLVDLRNPRHQVIRPPVMREHDRSFLQQQAPQQHAPQQQAPQQQVRPPMQHCPQHRFPINRVVPQSSSGMVKSPCDQQHLLRMPAGYMDYSLRPQRPSVPPPRSTPSNRGCPSIHWDRTVRPGAPHNHFACLPTAATAHRPQGHLPMTHPSRPVMTAHPAAMPARPQVRENVFTHQTREIESKPPSLSSQTVLPTAVSPQLVEVAVYGPNKAQTRPAPKREKAPPKREESREEIILTRYRRRGCCNGCHRDENALYSPMSKLDISPENPGRDAERYKAELEQDSVSEVGATYTETSDCLMGPGEEPDLTNVFDSIFQNHRRKDDGSDRSRNLRRRGEVRLEDLQPFLAWGDKVNDRGAPPSDWLASCVGKWSGNKPQLFPNHEQDLEVVSDRLDSVSDPSHTLDSHSAPADSLEVQTGGYLRGEVAILGYRRDSDCGRTRRS